MLTKLLNCIKYYWKRALMLLLLAAIGGFFAANTYKAGFELGKMVGRCEMACSILEAGFSGFEYENTCQCEQMSGFILTVPINHSFFE